MKLKLGEREVNIEDIEDCRFNDPLKYYVEGMKPFLYVKLKTGEEFYTETAELINEEIKTTPEELVEYLTKMRKTQKY